MKNNKLSKFILVFFTMMMVSGCSVEPTYYSQVTPELYFDSQEKVYQRFARPFTHWAYVYGAVPRSRFTALQTLSSDEIVMPSRGGDWYDDGFYLRHYYHQFTPDFGYDTYAWDAFSMGVAQAWSAIEDIDRYVDFDALKFPEGTREAMLNQLQTLVAYFYLFALDHFGGVPLYTSNQGEVQGRATDQETFDFVEKLLKESLPKLPLKTAGTAETGSISRGVAASLLARLYFNANVYIKKDMFAECASICTDIKNGVYGPYALAGDWTDIFGFTNATCPELIWVVPSENGKRQVGGGNPEHSTHYNTKAYLDNPEAASWNGFCLTPSLDSDGKSYKYGASDPSPKGTYKLGCPYTKFEDNDVRKQNYLYEGNGKFRGMFLAGKLINPITGAACTADGSREYQSGDTIPMVDQIAQLSKPVDVRREGALYAEENSGVRLMKFSPIPNAADNALRFNPEVPVIRFTEIQYMLAECKMRAGDKAGAASLINEVRARYFTTTGGDPNPVTAANLDEYRILDEWLIEFIGEGRRRTDLVRWDKFTTEAWWDHPADGSSKSYYNRFPIPSQAINANNKLEQNPGYY
jgi:hypothetical protein